MVNKKLTRIIKCGSIKITNTIERMFASLMRIFLYPNYAGIRNPNISNKVQYFFIVLVESQHHSFIGAITKKIKEV